jgi:hypothetical protein
LGRQQWRLRRVCFKVAISAVVWIILTAIGIAFVAFVFYARRKKTMGSFRAEVVIEQLRLWRSMVEDYRRKYPDDALSKKMSVAEEAIYMAENSPQRDKVWEIAVANVKKMTLYHVQECKSGKAVRDWMEVYANSDQEAAKKLVGPNLRRVGKLSELRTRVRLANDLKQETLFYSDQ